MKAAERSRAYPVLCLEDGRRVIGEILARLGDGSFSREVLGEIIGYSNAHGGPGARKIAALAQYGFLRRRAGLYSPTSLAREVVEPRSEAARSSALCRALHQPPLFASLLDRYVPQGRAPSQLASVLWRDFGITRKASRMVADTFCKSARYAGVLDRDGKFLPGSEAPHQTLPHQTLPHQTLPHQTLPHQTLVDVRPGADHAGDAGSGDHDFTSEPEQRFELILTGGRVARLFLPRELQRRDLEIVRGQIDFLEYQVTQEDDE